MCRPHPVLSLNGDSRREIYRPASHECTKFKIGSATPHAPARTQHGRHRTLASAPTTVDDGVNMDDHSRRAAAWLLGVLAVVGLVLLWLFVLAFSFLLVAFDSYSSTYQPRSTQIIVAAGLALWGIVVTFFTARIMFRTVRSRVEWALRTTESPTPTKVAKIVTAVFAAAAAVPIIYWLSLAWCRA